MATSQITTRFIQISMSNNGHRVNKNERNKLSIIKQKITSKVNASVI